MAREDTQALVQHEQQPPAGAALDDAYDDERVQRHVGFVGDDDEDGANAISAAAPLRRPSSDYHSVHLQRSEVRISHEPPDSYSFTYYVFYLLGVATMTPWNFFVTAEDYWMYKFRNTTLNETGVDAGADAGADLIEDLTPMQKTFACDLTLTASVAGTTMLILNAVYGQRVPLRLKMLGMLLTILALFIVTTAFVEIDTDSWQEQFFVITLFTVVLINMASATMSGGIFGIAGVFPTEYMTALVSGQALGGIFTALAFILVLACGADPTTTAMVYFTIGSLLVALSIAAYASMARTPFFKYYVEEGGDKYQILCETPSHNRGVDTGVPLEPNVHEVFSKIYMDAVSICLLFSITLSVYPSISVLMTSEHYGNGNPWNDVYFMPVVNYLVFNSGDYFGRILAGLWKGPSHAPQTALLMTVLRALFVPFFLCANTSLHQFLPVLVHSDAAFIAMMVGFSLSNGYLANVIFVNAPRLVLQHEKELASSIMAASLSCGIALGSMLSMVFVQML